MMQDARYTSAESPAKRRMQPLVAWRAMQVLLKDKEDTAQVFTIIRALGGGEVKGNLRRFKATPAGRRALAERRDLLDVLTDRTYLATLPDGSLGRAYLDFIRAEDLTADGLVDASIEGGDLGDTFTEDERLFRRRTRDMHDLWHVVTGYGRDEIGELCLLAFTYSQLRNLGVRFIIWIGGREARKALPRLNVRAAIREGFAHGKQAVWLPALDWEDMLAQPLTDIRQMIGYQRQGQYFRVVRDLMNMDAPGYESDPLAPLPATA